MDQSARFIDGVGNASASSRGDWFWFGRRVFSPVREEFVSQAGAAENLEVGELSETLYRYLYLPGRAIPIVHNHGRQVVQTRLDEQRELEDALKAYSDLRSQPHSGEMKAAEKSSSDYVTLSQAPAITSEGFNFDYLPGWVCTGVSRVPDPSFRIYLNAAALDAASIFSSLVGELDTEEIPFFGKVLSDRASYEVRTDSVVFLFAKSDLEAALSITSQLVHSGKFRTRSGCPSLTLEIFDGVAVAQSAPVGRSFGSHRCEQAARALVECHRQGDSLLTTFSARFQETLRAAGVSTEYPFLMQDAADSKSFRRSITSLARPKPPKRRPDSSALQVRGGEGSTTRLAMQLLDSAIWSDGLCSWLASDPTSGGDALVSSNGSLYAGSAGIALSLAAYSSVLGNEHAHLTAVAALRHASAHCALATERSSLYEGPLGVAIAATLIARMGLLAKEEAREIAQRSIHCSLTSAENESPNRSLDLLNGLAGEMIAMAFLSREHDKAEAEDRAKDIYFELIDLAEPSPRGISWAEGEDVFHPNQINLAHGAIGIAAALEACAKFLSLPETDAIQGAISYCESWMVDADRCIDLRQLSSVRTNIPPSLPVSPGWCNGASGYLLATRFLANRGHLPTNSPGIAIALRDLFASLAEFPQEQTSEWRFGLCHGYSGQSWAAEAWTGSAASPKSSSQQLLAEVDDSIPKLFSQDSVRTQYGRLTMLADPSLMTGSAGAILFSYRQRQPSVIRAVLEPWSLLDDAN